MTRINAAIPPSWLTKRHLLSEHREIKRIPNVIKSGRFNMDKQPIVFTLGTGHVKFFYDKQKYLYNRYVSIYNECIRRGYNVTDYSEAWDCFHGPNQRLDLVGFWNDWHETDETRILLSERINDRLGIIDKSYKDWYELELIKVGRQGSRAIISYLK